MSADECRWVRMMLMGALMCNNDKTREDGYGGAVRMHDLGSRVAGKFPGTSCSDTLCQKIGKTRNKHTDHGASAI